MISKNYKKIAIINKDQELNTSQEIWEDVSIYLNLNFDPSKVMVGIDAYHTGGGAGFRGTHIVDSEYHNSKKYRANISASQCYMKFFSRNYITLCVYKAAYQKLGGLHIIAIE